MIPAVILAGGRATRMGGGDKCRILVDGQTILDRTLAVLRPHCAPIALNANGDPARFADTGLVVLPDTIPDQPGPLAGLLAGLEWAASLGAPTLLTVPGDCPFLPPDLVPRLHGAAAELALASSAGRIHPVVGLWPVRRLDALRRALAAGERRVADWVATYAATAVDWPAEPVDPFLNLNAPTDLPSPLGEGWVRVEPQAQA